MNARRANLLILTKGNEKNDKGVSLKTDIEHASYTSSLQRLTLKIKLFTSTILAKKTGMSKLEQNEANVDPSWRHRLHKIVAYCGLGILVIGPVFLGIFITIPKLNPSDDFVNFVLRNYPVFFVLPYIGCLAYFLVITLEATRGPIEVEIVGVKIKGAGGPLLFWVIVFVAVTSAVKSFWTGWPGP